MVVVHEQCPEVSTAPGYPPFAPWLPGWPQLLQVLNASAQPLRDHAYKYKGMTNITFTRTSLLLAFNFLDNCFDLGQFQTLIYDSQYRICDKAD